MRHIRSVDVISIKAASLQISKYPTRVMMSTGITLCIAFISGMGIGEYTETVMEFTPVENCLGIEFQSQ